MAGRRRARASPPMTSTSSGGGGREQQVGPAAITDANGVFTISFRWCCGWLPIWWWRLRHWALEPVLASRILSVLRLDDRCRARPTPDPVPDLRVFAGLLGPGRPLPSPRRPFDPDSSCRSCASRCSTRLPRLPELEQLRLWPWFPWTPWLDCTPDIIFRATQNCDGVEKTMLAETRVRRALGHSQCAQRHARGQRPGLLHQPPPPHGDCIVLTHACSDPGHRYRAGPGQPARRPRQPRRSGGRCGPAVRGRGDACAGSSATARTSTTTRSSTRRRRVSRRRGRRFLRRPQAASRAPTTTSRRADR